ncbi:hypothetical protein C8J56DRAFT_889368 [Mycena floridula]|nr:hypothetical protein C8J56DRAFT_889368 [Mycena floridula]
MLSAKFILAAFSAFVAVSAAPEAGALRRQSECKIILKSFNLRKVENLSKSRKLWVKFENGGRKSRQSISAEGSGPVLIDDRREVWDCLDFEIFERSLIQLEMEGITTQWEIGLNSSYPRDECETQTTERRKPSSWLKRDRIHNPGELSESLDIAEQYQYFQLNGSLGKTSQGLSTESGATGNPSTPEGVAWFMLIFLLDEHGIKMGPSSAESKGPGLTIWILERPNTLFVTSNFFIYLVHLLICLSSSDGVPNGLPSDGLDPTESGDGVFGHLSNRERGNKKAWPSRFGSVNLTWN